MFTDCHPDHQAPHVAAAHALPVHFDTGLARGDKLGVPKSYCACSDDDAGYPCFLSSSNDTSSTGDRMVFNLPDRASFKFPVHESHDILRTQADGIAIVGIIVGGVYHFRVFLFNLLEKRCLRIDCNPLPIDANGIEKACVDFATKKYLYPIPPIRISEISRSTGAFSYGLQPHVQIGTILELLFTHLKRDKYLFYNGRGCRHWCATILNDLETHGFVSNGATGHFETWEMMKHRELGTYFPMPRIQGAFYN
ncbi:uncharacterized protein BT62DRAFT_923425 [Guyanagaster necrorhizus]|uniref:DUF7770 domain-containing protein n=1 Tax=Guyanagaster necrorhizus TaxID=856835 RepID=A0A9P8AMX7_9AGAR|nr:uncharacterized protein BT62DRAFT_923425 [Guyanagaster necrorhizus MCA 3950]KAG7441335.1 hypothetical protein BT62DRAFT_923425 [Guyanagaster necrorhizus MCA 3950]